MDALAAEIAKSPPREIVLFVVLKGHLVFAADPLRALDRAGPPSARWAEHLVEDVGGSLFRELRRSGMHDVPDRFSVAAAHQEIPRATLAEIGDFIRLFDRVTMRGEWREALLGGVGEPLLPAHEEACFFGAWDFHVPPGRPDAWQLIEFNDNGSGHLFAALINRTLWEISGPSLREKVEAPPPFASIERRVAEMVEHEARSFFGGRPEGSLLIVDDAESLRQGRFRDELALLCDGLSRAGWSVGLGAPEELRDDGRHLLWHGRRVAFVVNRSTDFWFRDARLTPLRDAWRAGRAYVAPNPASYATRSDKRLLEPLSRPLRDAALGIRPEERERLSAHVPETWLVRDEDVATLASRRDEFVFKPAHGFGGRGLLGSAEVGRSRLRRLLRRGEPYVAQRRVGKPRLLLASAERDAADVWVWTDLRVWAWRGEPWLLSGRASRRPDRIDLSPPGGWIATYSATRNGG